MKPLRELSQDERAALSDDEIFELVATDIEARQRGGPNRKAEHLALARSAEMAEEIERLYTEAEAKQTSSASVISPGIMASLNAVYEKVQATKGKNKTEAKPAPKPKVVAFHPSDHARAQPKLPTIKEKQAALARLAELYDTDPLAYAKERVELAAKRDAIDKAVRIEREKQTDDSEQSQATNQ